MISPIKTIGFYQPRIFLLFCAFLSSVTPNGSTALAQIDMQRQTTMVDIMRYMNSHKDLPEYCQCRMAQGEFREKFRNRENPDTIDWPPQFTQLCSKWSDTIGISYNFLHHYCFGIMRIHEALRETDETKKKSTLNWALQEFQYVEGAKERTFPFWPQLFIFKSRIYLQLDQPEMARKALQQAAEFQKQSQSGR